MRKLSKSMVEMLRYVERTNVGKSGDRGWIRTTPPWHYENRVVHEAILRRGLIRVTSRNKYVKLTAAGRRALREIGDS